MRRFVLPLALTLAACATQEPVSEPQPQPGLEQATQGVQLRGTVVDAQSGKVVPHATICEFAEQVPCVRTNPDGSFELGELPQGSQTILEVYARGYEKTLYAVRLHDADQAPRLSLVTEGHWKALATQAGVTPKPDTGDVRLVTRRWLADRIVPMAGMTVEPRNEEADVWYLGKQNEVTGPSGETIVWNSTPGLWTYQFRFEDEALLCAARFGWQQSEDDVLIPVMAGYLTHVEHTCMVVPDLGPID
jgi:hypothetical protein